MSRPTAENAAPGAAPLDQTPDGVPLRRALVTLVATLGSEVAVLGVYFLLVEVGVLPRPGGGALVALLWVATAVAVAVVHHVLVRRGGLTLRQLGYARPTWRLLHLLWQAPLGVLLAAATGAGVLRLTTGSTVRAGGADDLGEYASAGPLVIVPLLVLVVVVTPLWEEALFRGAVFLGLRGHGGELSAVLGSAALFALFHAIPRRGRSCSRWDSSWAGCAGSTAPCGRASSCTP